MQENRYKASFVVELNQIRKSLCYLQRSCHVLLPTLLHESHAATRFLLTIKASRTTITKVFNPS